MNKQYMVLGIKEFSVKDEKTEKDNPFVFNSLIRAIEVAQETAEYNKKNHGCFFARVVELKSVLDIE